MNKNRIIILVTVVIFLIIGVAYLMFPPITPHEDQLNETPEEVEEITEIVEEKEIIEVNKEEMNWVGGDLRFEISESELKINAKLPFKAGDEFEYHCITEYSDIHQVFIVEEVKRIKGSDYYVIRTKAWGKQKLDKWQEILKGEGNVGLHYDKETGKAFEMKDYPEYELKDMGSDPQRGLPIYYWMLALNDDFKWERMWNTTGLGVHYENKYMYEVVGREKIKGRECFKVEKKIMDLKSKEIIEKTVFWVDVETRVLIKEITYADNISICENNLLSAPFLDKV